jgi:hypothetical protein
MKTKHMSLAALLAVVLAGCQTTTKPTNSKREFAGCPTTDFTLSIECTSPNMAFTGTIATDGEEQKVSGIGSGRYHVSTHHLVCVFAASTAEGKLLLTVTDEGPSQARSIMGPAHGIRVDYLRGPNEQHTLSSTF